MEIMIPTAPAPGLPVTKCATTYPAANAVCHVALAYTAVVGNKVDKSAM